MSKPETRILDLEFTYLEFHPSYVISTIQEGIVLDSELLHKLVNACTSHYDSDNFVYISNRKHAYNVDPMIYLRLLKIQNLRGIAIASESLPSLKTANFERHFSPVPLEIFHSLEEAKSWSRSILREE